MAFFKIICLGTDPEAVPVNAEGTAKAGQAINGELCTTEKFGDKHAPLPMKELGEGFTVIYDNVGVEVQVPPTTNYRDFRNNFRKAFDWIQERLYPGYVVAFIASAEMEPSDLMLKNAMTFGCEPEYDPRKRQAIVPKNAEGTMLRTFGGHIHFGLDMEVFKGLTPEEHEAKMLVLIQAYDRFVAVPHMINDPDTRRQELYGSPGSFRDKPYGIELRVCSNNWGKDDAIMAWFLNQIKVAVAAANQQIENPDPNWELVDEQVVELLTSVDKEAATEFCNAHGISLEFNKYEDLVKDPDFNFSFTE